MIDARHIVLIHGAWQGAWAFDAWTPHLRERGWRVHALDLPGNGWGPAADAPASLDAYAATVVERILAIDEPVVLVGHSGGGITATQATEAVPDHVAATVYLAGMMLPSGWSFADVLAQCRRDDPQADLAGIGPWLEPSPDGRATRVRPDGALRIFLHDCEPDAAREAAARLRWQPDSGRSMRPAWSPQRAGRVPRVYVECTRDRSVTLPVQRTMQALTPGAYRVSLDTGHVPQLARPAELTDALTTALTQLPPSLNC